VFTIKQRDALREQVLSWGQDDDRVLAGAIVGSLALDSGDPYSDLDLMFGIADHVAITDVLDDWTRWLIDRVGGVRLVDLERGSTVYRVFLLPGALQLDLSMAPATHFRPTGPRFRLVFGQTARTDAEALARSAVGTLFISTPAVARDIFGWGVIYALHARACIERGRVWQAEHYVGAVRDHALSLSCLRLGITPAQARGYDDLPEAILDQVAAGHVGVLETEPLRVALEASVAGLLGEGTEFALPQAEVVIKWLGEIF
jgi:hypothetical protein